MPSDIADALSKLRNDLSDNIGAPKVCKSVSKLKVSGLMFETDTICNLGRHWRPSACQRCNLGDTPASSSAPGIICIRHEEEIWYVSLLI
jgi:hypothetical protein